MMFQFQGINMKCFHWYNEPCKTVRPGWLFSGVPYVNVKLCGYCLRIWLIVLIVFNQIVYICPFLNGISGPHERTINVSQNPSKSKYRTHSFAKKKLQQILLSIRATLFCQWRHCFVYDVIVILTIFFVLLPFFILSAFLLFIHFINFLRGIIIWWI